MGWVKIDDGFLDHPKYLEAGPLAGYLCLAAIAWCARNRTDGWIPRRQVRRLVDFDGFTQDAHALDLAEILVEVGLWEREGDGFRVHDFLDWQQSKEEIAAATEQRREAGRRGGRARRPSTSSSGLPSDSSSASLDGSLSVSPSASSSEASSEMPSRCRSRSRSTPPLTPPQAGGRQRDRDRFVDWCRSVAAGYSDPEAALPAVHRALRTPGVSDLPGVHAWVAKWCPELGNPAGVAA